MYEKEQMQNLKIQQLIVLVALFVSLIGTLLLLQKINETAKEIPATPSVVVEDNTEFPRVVEADNAKVRILDEEKASVEH